MSKKGTPRNGCARSPAAGAASSDFARARARSKSLTTTALIAGSRASIRAMVASSSSSGETCFSRAPAAPGRARHSWSSSVATSAAFEGPSRRSFQRAAFDRKDSAASFSRQERISLWKSCGPAARADSLSWGKKPHAHFADRDLVAIAGCAAEPPRPPPQEAPLAQTPSFIGLLHTSERPAREGAALRFGEISELKGCPYDPAVTAIPASGGLLVRLSAPVPERAGARPRHLAGAKKSGGAGGSRRRSAPHRHRPRLFLRERCARPLGRHRQHRPAQGKRSGPRAKTTDASIC